MNRRRAAGHLLVSVWYLVALPVAWAQAESTDHLRKRDRQLAERKREALQDTEERILRGQQQWLLHYGGWVNTVYLDSHNDDNNAAVQDAIDDSVFLDTRLWAKLVYRPQPEREHALYVRVRNEYLWRWSFTPDKDNNGPHLDMAYLTLDANPFWVQVGRQYFSLGRGIAYSDVHDGVALRAVVPDWSLTGLASHSLPHEDNLDTSIPGSDKESDRNFFGVEARYLGLPSQSLYAFWVLQRDESNELPLDPAHTYVYDTEHVGIGVEGTAMEQLHYWTELIWQGGASYIHATDEEQDIAAWGLITGLTYETGLPTHPRFTLEYAGSRGDADRVNVTNTLLGNGVGEDKGFSYFGYFPTSYALAPRLSNLHVIKFSAGFTPFEAIDRLSLRTLQADASYYLFRKHESAGGISDLDATLNHREIGSEVDFTVAWSPTADLDLTLLYGHFFPGNAYPATADKPERYLYLSTTLSF